MRDAPKVPRSLRWLLPLGMAITGLAHAWAGYFPFEGGGLTYEFWVEVGLFGILGPGLVWWVLGLAFAYGERESQARQRLAQIEGAAHALVSSLDLEEVLRQVCSLAVAQAGITMAWVGLIEPGSFRVRAVAAAGAPTDYLQDIVVTWDDSPTGRGPTGTAIRTGQPVVESDIAGSFGFAPWRAQALARGFRSSMAIPLRVGDQTLGALNIYSGQPAFFTPEVVQGFLIFADQAAVAIANARFVAENSRRAALLDELSARLSAELPPPAILQVTVDAARELLGAQYAAALLRDPSDGAPTHFVSAGWDEPPEYLTLPQGRGLFSLVLGKGEVLRLADLSQHPLAAGFPPGHPAMKSLVAVPISARGEVVLGCLYAADKVGLAEFPEEDEQMALVLARQAAVALENARLLGESQRRAQRLEVISEIGRLIGVAPVLQEVFPQVVEQLQRLLSFDRTWIVFVDEAQGEARVAVQWGQAPSRLGPGATFPLENSSIGWVVEHNQPYFATDLAQECPFQDDQILCQEEGIRSYLRLPLYSRGRVFAVFGVGSNQPSQFAPDALEVLQPIAITAAQALDNVLMLEELRRRHDELERTSQALGEHVVHLEGTQRRLQEAYLGILRTLNLVMEARDPYLRGHADRDAQFARTVARELGLSDEEVRWVETAAQLHDIGKLAIPDSVLLKPGPLDPAEWAVMRRHPTVAVDMLRFLDFLSPALPLIEGDHERWDGQGYPRGLRNDEIPLGARILAVADAYDAMTSSRPYRPAMNHERACGILREGAGTQWDPRVVETFLTVYGEAPPR